MMKHGYFMPYQMYLVSYPRSGANWLRYCIEAIGGSPTHGVKPLNPLTPLDESVEEAARGLLDVTLGVDLDAPVLLQHSHRWEEPAPCAEILLIVRNHKECILRDYRGGPRSKEQVRATALENSLEILCNEDGIKDYAGLLQRYVEHTGPKHIVYFEDLKLKPRETLLEVMEFLSIENPKVDAFMEYYDRHNQVSVLIYNNGVSKSYTLGKNTMSLHSDEFLTLDDKRKWDQYIETHHPDIVPLVERYFEPRSEDD